MFYLYLSVISGMQGTAYNPGSRETQIFYIDPQSLNEVYFEKQRTCFKRSSGCAHCSAIYSTQI